MEIKHLSRFSTHHIAVFHPEHKWNNGTPKAMNILLIRDHFDKVCKTNRVRSTLFIGLVHITIVVKDMKQVYQLMDDGHEIRCYLTLNREDPMPDYTNNKEFTRYMVTQLS